MFKTVQTGSRRMSLFAVLTLLAALSVVSLGAGAASAAPVDFATVGSAKYPIAEVNQPRLADQLVAYTPSGGQITSPANRWGVDVAITRGVVTAVADRQTTDAVGLPIPAQGVVLSGHGAARLWLLAYAKAGAVVGLPSALSAPEPDPAPRMWIGTSSFALSGRDVPRTADALVEYTRTGNQTVSPANQWGVEVAISGDKTVEVRDRQVSAAGPTTIPADGYVLSGHGAARLWLLAHASVGSVVTSPSSSPAPAPTVQPMPALNSGLPARVVAAYWRTDSSPPLTAASSRINLFFLSFAKSAQSGTGKLFFNPNEGGGISSAQMQADITAVQARGARVILSIGGSVDGGITMRTPAQVRELTSSVNTICDTYHCDGIDWDLERGGAGTNLTSLVSASAQLKAARGESFAVTASVEPGLGLYEQFALASGSATVNGKSFSGPVCDLYGPQFYDYAQGSAERRAGIVANATKMVSKGLPASKYAIGTTYAGSYLGSAGQMSPGDYLLAMQDLQNGGIAVRGAYVWDMTIESQNRYIFAETFGKALDT